MFEKIVVVTRKTRMEELIDRFLTKSQAKFYIEHAGGDFAEYQSEHENYLRALEETRHEIDIGLKIQFIDRFLVPTARFTAHDIVITLGQDGLVANTAKYIGSQPLIAVNPDPSRFDGILLPFRPSNAGRALREVMENFARFQFVTLAEAVLSDGQRLLAFNDLFIGPASHISARYAIRFGKRSEPHSSSGVIVATGAGSTGWLSSVFNMASGVTQFCGGESASPFKFGWDDRRLFFVVREAFRSKHSSADIVAGWIDEGSPLILESQMPRNGIIFSDGIESDYLGFNSGATVVIKPAEARAKLVVPIKP